MSLKAFLSGGDLPKAANNLLADLKTKAGEVATKVKNTFSGAGDFKKLAGEATALEKSAAEQAFKRAAAQVTDPTGEVMTSIDDMIWEQSPTPWEGHDLDRDAADQEAIRQMQEGEVSAAAVNAAKAETEIDTKHRVRLQEIGPNNSIIAEVDFLVMPEIVESRTVEYEAIAPPQFPSAFQKYKGTSSTQWTVNATLTCRTTTEATNNLRIINILRGWTVPFFGSKTAEQFPQKLGAPPPVLTLSGWREQMVGPVQVVITSLNWNFPQDVDYIPAMGFKMSNDGPGQYVPSGKTVPFPTVIKIAIQLVESFSTDQMNGFSVADFRVGQFGSAFVPLPRSNQAMDVPAPQTEAQTPPPNATANPATRVGTERGRATTGASRPPPQVVDTSVVSEEASVGYISPEEPLTNRSAGFDTWEQGEVP